MGPGVGDTCNFQVGICTLMKTCRREEGILFSSAEGESERLKISVNSRKNIKIREILVSQNQSN